jgi:hypothetical protein
MKSAIKRLLFLLLLICLGVFHVEAATYYVAANGTNPISPYTDWSTAATNIQDATSLAVSGDTVLVTNGIYQYGGNTLGGYNSNRVYVANGVLVQSVNGPVVTSIVGYQVPGTTNGNNAVRCVYLNNLAILSGFTLTNGATPSGGEGGGAIVEPGAMVTNCVIVGNAASYAGGGCWSFNQGNPQVVNCIIKNNVAPNGSGVYECNVYDSLLTGNGGTTYGNAAYGGTYYNCTIAGNTSQSLGAALGCTLINCIIYYNTNGAYSDANRCFFTNCCATAKSIDNLTLPNNNITNPPAFVNPSSGDYHLLIGSPGIDCGNDSYVTTGTDLDGNPRIVNGTVDMGCYENQNTNEVLYASLSSTNPVAPYTNWLTAATNIQAAIGSAQPGGIVVVNSGVYTNDGTVIYGQETNVVALTNGITLLGLYGWQSTIIKGGTQMRCAYVGSNSVLNGFTLTNGSARTGGNLTNEQSGGGIWCQPGALVLNCLIISNYANFPHTYSGGSGGGIYGGTISNCTVAWNTAGSGGGVGGGASVWNCIFSNNVANGGGGASASVLNGCVLSNNVAAYNGNYGVGGALSNCLAYNCTMTGNSISTGEGGGSYLGTNFNCFIVGNFANFYGGGTYQSTNYDCVISNNSAFDYGGGADGGVLYNCLVAFNTASNSISFYGLGGGAYSALVYNCTVVSNSATGGGGGLYDGSAYNTIIMFNTVTGAVQNVFGVQVSYCCVVPTPFTYYGADFTNDPVFVNPAAGDFHLQYNSPCINAGGNVWVTTTNDLDGNPRIVGYAVDVGAYEKSPASIIPNWWLFEYGFTNDGSADYVDSDDTGMPNWEKWKAGLNPTNPASVLAMSAPAPTNNTLGITVTWQSVTNIIYYVQQSTNLPVFYPIQSNIVGQAGTTSFTDTTATNAGPYFYRVGVQ